MRNAKRSGRAWGTRVCVGLAALALLGCPPQGADSARVAELEERLAQQRAAAEAARAELREVRALVGGDAEREVRRDIYQAGILNPLPQQLGELLPPERLVRLTTLSSEDAELAQQIADAAKPEATPASLQEAHQRLLAAARGLAHVAAAEERLSIANEASLEQARAELAEQEDEGEELRARVTRSEALGEDLLRKLDEAVRALRVAAASSEAEVQQAAQAALETIEQRQ